MNQTDIAKIESQKYLTLNDLFDFDQRFVELQQLLCTTNARQLLYHYKHNTVSVPKCPVCDTSLKWNADLRCYRKFCSKRCTAIGSVQQAKSTSLKKYGQEHYAKTNEFKDRVAATSQERFGAEHYSKTQEYHQRKIKTSQEKYGVDHPAQNADIKQKTKETCLKKYNCTNASKLPETIKKLKQTKKQKYGNENYNNYTKAQQTNLSRYGVDHPLKNSKIAKSVGLSRKLNYYPPSVLDKLNDPEWLSDQFLSGLTVGEIAKVLGVSASNLCKYFNAYDININIGRNSSAIEREVTEYIRSQGVTDIELNNRSLLGGTELDIILPNHKLAIEVNGLYWHTESKGKHKYYHQNKTLKCKEQGYQLLHIVDQDWVSKQDIWKSIISTKLGLNQKVYARKCQIAELTTAHSREFFEENHLGGFVGGKIKLGLFYQGELIQSVIIGKPRFNKKYEYELIRLATKKGLTVVGGASRLLAKISGSMISYADASYSDGNLYKKLGFVQIGSPSLDYYYVKQNKMYPRTQFQKHKLSKVLENFDPRKTELENMQANGYERFWGAGQLTFVKN